MLRARSRRYAERISQMIRDRHAPRRIYQWGSLLERRKFQDISDIDIAVEGLSGPEQIFVVYGGRLVYERTE